jgi:hypothetical protein
MAISGRLKVQGVERLLGLQIQKEKPQILLGKYHAIRARSYLFTEKMEGYSRGIVMVMILILQKDELINKIFKLYINFRR